MSRALLTRPKTDTRQGAALLSQHEWQAIAESLRLSPRELQIIQGVFDDGKEVAIAHQLKISRHTVHTYLERIYRKLAVNSRVQVVVRVMAEHRRLTEKRRS